jgi:hypothetical protein
MNMVADDRFSQTDNFRYEFVPIQSAVGEKPVSRISPDQLTHNETPSVIAVCVCNPDRLSLRIHG